MEPASKAFKILLQNTKSHKDMITYHHKTGENYEVKNVDVAISLGVIHHIPDPSTATS